MAHHRRTEYAVTPIASHTEMSQPAHTCHIKKIYVVAWASLGFIWTRATVGHVGLVSHRTVAWVWFEDQSVCQCATYTEISRSQLCCQLEQHVRPAMEWRTFVLMWFSWVSSHFVCSSCCTRLCSHNPTLLHNWPASIKQKTPNAQETQLFQNPKFIIVRSQWAVQFMLLKMTSQKTPC